MSKLMRMYDENGNFVMTTNSVWFDEKGNRVKDTDWAGYRNNTGNSNSAPVTIDESGNKLNPASFGDGVGSYNQCGRSSSGGYGYKDTGYNSARIISKKLGLMAKMKLWMEEEIDFLSCDIIDAMHHSRVWIEAKFKPFTWLDMLYVLVIGLFGIPTWIYGIVFGFNHSFALGLVSIFPPLGFIEGVLHLFGII